MKCPNCAAKLSVADLARRRCSRCGRAFDRTEVGLVRTSSVRVAAGDRDAVFRSIDELPPDLRRQLRQAIGSPEAETIFIADEQGREQIFQAIAGLPPEVQKKVQAAIRLAAPPGSPPGRSRAWRLVLVLGALAALALLLFWIWNHG